MHASPNRPGMVSPLVAAVVGAVVLFSMVGLKLYLSRRPPASVPDWVEKTSTSARAGTVDRVRDSGPRPAPDAVAVADSGVPTSATAVDLPADAPVPTSEQMEVAPDEQGRSGDYSSSYPDGSRRNAGRLDDGRRAGRWQFWSPRGDLVSTQTFVAGVPHGPYALYHPTGQPSAQGQVAAGQPNGCWEYFDPQGRLLKRGQYDRGVAVGQWQVFDAQGRLRLLYWPDRSQPPKYVAPNDQETQLADCGCGEPG